METQLLRVFVMVCIGTYLQAKSKQMFLNFFNSIAPSEVKNIQQEVTREQLAFDTMREELHVAQNKNTNKKRNFHQIGYVGKNVWPAKRETNAVKENHIGRFDIRVGKIVSVELHPDNSFFYILIVDIGEKELRKMVLPIVMQLIGEELRNRTALFLVNKKMYRITVQEGTGSIFYASEFGKIDILTPPETAVPGDRVMVNGYKGEPNKEINTKIDPMYEEIMKDMKTNEKKEALYRGELLSVAGKGPATASTMANIRIYTA